MIRDQETLLQPQDSVRLLRNDEDTAQTGWGRT